MLDTLILARIQFAFTISFHILFPAFTIGLASWLAMLEFLWLRTGKAAYWSLYRFWLKIFDSIANSSGCLRSITPGRSKKYSDATAKNSASLASP